MINEDCQHCFKYQIKKKKKRIEGKKKKKQDTFARKSGNGQRTWNFHSQFDFFYWVVICSMISVTQSSVHAVELTFFFFLLFYITVITEQHPRPLLYLGILPVSDGGKQYWQVEDKS